MSNGSSNFYVAGGTLSLNTPSYVHRQADEALYSGLMDGDFCYALTSRQMGKSSLMVRTAMRLRAEGIIVVVLDLTSIGQNLTSEQWYDGLLNKIGQQLHLEDELEDFWMAHERLSALQRFMGAIREVVLPRSANHVVIFVDEIDTVRSLPFPTDEFFAGIREFYNARTQDAELSRLTFCLLGVATPSDLISDTRTTPFNIGRRVELEDFTEAEAVSLTVGLGRMPTQGAKLLKRILYWTGGHPYLTQRLCQAVAEDRSVRRGANVDRLCEELFFSSRARERDDNLLFVRERLLRGEADRGSLLDLYRRVRSHQHVRDDDVNQLLSLLRLSGITRAAKGYLYVRNRIYYRVFDREWVRANMPDAELQRQRSAYRRGLIRAAAVSLIIIVIVSGLAVAAVRQRNRALEESERNRRLSYDGSMSLAQQAWEKANIPRLLEILESQKPAFGENDLRGFEWNYLWRVAHSDLLTFKGHKRSVESVAFSPDGKRIASVSRDGSGKIWDAATAQVLLTLNGHESDVFSIAFSADGKLLATGSRDKTARVWESSTGYELLTLRGHKGAVRSVAFSPDGKRVATASEDTTAKIWDVKSGSEIKTLKGHKDRINSIAYSLDAKRLATASWDKTVKLWDATTGQEIRTLTGHENFVSSVAFSPDARKLATGSADDTALIWNADSGKEIVTLRGHTSDIHTVAFSPDGTRLATGSWDRTTRLWDVSTGQEAMVFRGHDADVMSINFSPDGKLLATASYDATAKLWNLSRKQGVIDLRGHTDRAVAVAYSPDGRLAASGSWDKTAKIWDAINYRELFTLKGHEDHVNAVAFSPNGRVLATGSKDQMTKLWDARSGQQLMTLNGQSGRVNCLAFSHDGKLLVTGSEDGKVTFWDVKTGQTAKILNDSAYILAIAFSPDDRLLATTNWNDVARVWDVESGKTLHNFVCHAPGTSGFTPEGKRLEATREDYSNPVIFSPDGKRIVTGSEENTAIMWDVVTGQKLMTLSGHSAYIFGIAFSPDGKRLVTGSYDSTAIIWDMANGQEVGRLGGGSGGVMSIKFSPDGQQLLWCGWDSRVAIWSAID